MLGHILLDLEILLVIVAHFWVFGCFAGISSVAGKKRVFLMSLYKLVN